MKYLRSRAVATSSRKENFPECSFCGEKESSMYITVNREYACHNCRNKDNDVKFVDRER